MKNEFDDKYITNEVKKYIDNIQVPEELGGMIMKKVNNENVSNKKIKSGKKVKKNSGNCCIFGNCFWSRNICSNKM